MKFAGLLALLSAPLVARAVGEYYQCGGLGYTGDTACDAGLVCVIQNPYYYQCLKDAGGLSTAPASSSASTSTSSSSSKSSSSSTKSSTSSTKASSSTSSTKASTSTASQPTGSAGTGYVGYATLNGGTTGGAGGSTVRVSSLADLKTAVTGDTAAIVIITSSFSGNEVVKVGSNKSIYGASGSVTLTGVGLRIIGVNNVIVRNLKITKVLAEAGDAIGIQEANNVWIDHVDLSSDMDHDKDYYDGLLDITHGCQYITVSYSYLHDHWKGSLVGHSDSNGSEDTAIKVTYHHNYWLNLNSRTPSFRFGTGHIFNNYYQDCNDGINTRVGAQLLVENNVFVNVADPLYSTDSGYAVARGNDFGTGSNTALTGTLTTVPYSYSLVTAANVKAAVVGSAGATLTF